MNVQEAEEGAEAEQIRTGPSERSSPPRKLGLAEVGGGEWAG